MNFEQDNNESNWKDLKNLRDQIQQKLHSAGQEVREYWERHLEPRVDELEQQVKNATEAAKGSIKDALDKARQSFHEFQTTRMGRQSSDRADSAERGSNSSDEESRAVDFSNQSPFASSTSAQEEGANERGTSRSSSTPNNFNTQKENKENPQ